MLDKCDNLWYHVLVGKRYRTTLKGDNNHDLHLQDLPAEPGHRKVQERHPDSGSREEDGPRCYPALHLLQSAGARRNLRR